MPKGTLKPLHVTSSTTVKEVIEALLAKYSVTDNPKKYALFEQFNKKTDGEKKEGKLVSSVKITFSSRVRTSQTMKFSVNDFFSKCGQTCRKVRIWSRLLKKSLTENFIFRAVLITLFQLKVELRVSVALIRI